MVRKASLRRYRTARPVSRRVQQAIDKSEFKFRIYRSDGGIYCYGKSSSGWSHAANKITQPHDVLSMLRIGVQEVHDRRKYKLEHTLHAVSVLLKHISLARILTFARTPTVDTTACPWKGGWLK